MNTVSQFSPPASLFQQVTEDGKAFHFLTAAAADLELDPWPLMDPAVEGMEIVDGSEPERLGRVLWKSADEKQLLLVEELDPCTFVGTHGGEAIYMIKGRVRGTPPEGAAYELGPGDLAWFEAGCPDTWEVVERYRKLLWVSADRPLPYPGPSM